MGELEEFLSFLDTLTDEPVNDCHDLEEASEEYMQQVKARFLRTLEHPTAKDAFKAGAEWQKTKMVEGVVYRYERYQRIATAIIVDVPKESLGNKVKIIIVKEEEQ